MSLPQYSDLLRLSPFGLAGCLRCRQALTSLSANFAISLRFALFCYFVIPAIFASAAAALLLLLRYSYCCCATTAAALLLLLRYYCCCCSAINTAVITAAIITVTIATAAAATDHHLLLSTRLRIHHIPSIRGLTEQYANGYSGNLKRRAKRIRIKRILIILR